MRGGGEVRVTTRLRLRRADGEVYQDRWGIECRFGRVFLHRFAAPDPGADLHNHPWPFVSLVLRGGYVEQRCHESEAVRFAQQAARAPGIALPGPEQRRRLLSVRRFPLDECHRIVRLARVPTWTLVVGGPRRRGSRSDSALGAAWGFFTPDGFVPWPVYDATIRVQRRDLWVEISNAADETRPSYRSS